MSVKHREGCTELADGEGGRGGGASESHSPLGFLCVCVSLTVWMHLNGSV